MAPPYIKKGQKNMMILLLSLILALGTVNTLLYWGIYLYKWYLIRQSTARIMAAICKAQEKALEGSRPEVLYINDLNGD